MNEANPGTSRFNLFGAARPRDAAQALRDGLAGFQLAAMNIPQALGYTKIAGMPVVTGFYTLLLPLLAFATFGSSRYLVVGADSATAAILASGLTTIAPEASAQYVVLAAEVAMLTAAMLLIARVLGLGFLADFLSQTVLVGFLTGVGLQVGIASLPQMLDVEVKSRRAIVQLYELVPHLHQVNVLTAEISFAVVILVLGLRHLAPRIPAALIAVIGATAASALWNFAGRGVGIVGPITGGLPHLALPPLDWRQFDKIQLLVPIAASCFVVIVAQSAATARFYATRHHQRLDEDADLIGLAAANAVASLSGTFVVDGSPTQTAMVESSGGRSQLAQISTAAVVAIVLLFLTRPLQYLPRCVLGAIVFCIAIGLVDVKGLRDILRESPGEHLLALLTAAVVVLVGVEQAILVAMVLSLVRVLSHSYHPQTGVLVKGDQDVWEMRPPKPGTVTEPGLAIYHFGASLYYANAGQFSDEVRTLVGDGPPTIRWLIVDAEAIANLDYSAARTMRELYGHLKQIGVEFAFARVAPSLRADLIRHRIIEAIGEGHTYYRLHDARAAFAASQKINLPIAGTAPH